MQRSFFAAALLALLLLTFTSAPAQSPLGAVTGLALDPSNSPVPSAAVTLTSVETGIARESATNSTGVYSFPNLLPGSYKIAAQAKGFRNIETEAFPVKAYATVRQDLRLALGATETSVTVSASASTVIQMESPSITLSLSSKQILELPTNIRSVFNNAGDSGVISSMMPLTIPGIVQVGSGAKWLAPGGGANAMKLKVDGIETNFGNFGSPDPVSQPSMESIEEFTANIQTNRAEFGGLSTITTTTRAGTNQLHGDLFWYARNSALDARNTFALAKTFQNIQNFGGRLAGPAIKNKTFFHFTYDAIKGSRGYLFTSNVPTLAQRDGDFGGAAVRNPFTNENFAGGRIPAQLVSPQALKAQQQFFPLPNFGPPTLAVGNYRASLTGPESHRIAEIRLDHNFSSRHSAFARYQNKNSDYKIPGARTLLPPASVGTSTNIRNVNFATLGDVFTLRSNLYNEMRAGVVVLVSKSDADVRGQALLDLIGIKGLPSRTGIKGVPNMSITGYTSVGQILLNPVNDGHAQLSDNLTWIAGRHTIKGGFEYINWFVNRHLPTDGNLFGNFSFTNRFSGNPYADFLLGLPTQVTRLDPYPVQYNRFSDTAFFVQDDFKVTNRLTLSYGLRYEFNQPVKALDGNIYSFDLTSGAIVVPNENSRKLFSPYLPASIPVVTAEKVGLSETLRKSDHNNWAPRFGFSYQPTSGGKTVIRGGWGVYYAHFSGNIAGGLAAGPYSVSTTSTNAITNGRALFTTESPFAAPGASGTLNLSGINPRLLNSTTMQYTLSVERELLRDLGLRVSYIGSKSTQMPYRKNVNQPVAATTAFVAARRPYPLYNNVIVAESGANGNYNAMQVNLNKRLAKGLFWTSGWTWAKAIAQVDDTGDFELNTTIENTYDRRRERGNLYSVPRHQWMNQALYELPFLKRNRILGGWQVNALFNVQTGNFLSAAFAGSDPSNTNTIGGRPDVVSSVNYPKSLTAWYDRSAFIAPPANSGRFGNAGRGTIVGPGYSIFNLGLSKTFSLERFGRLQLSGSFQNLMNHVSYGEPNLTVSSPVAGTITSTHIFPAAGSPRTVLLSLRWSY